jgi:hypothetical protein
MSSRRVQMCAEWCLLYVVQVGTVWLAPSNQTWDFRLSEMYQTRDAPTRFQRAHEAADWCLVHRTHLRICECGSHISHGVLGSVKREMHKRGTPG